MIELIFFKDPIEVNNEFSFDLDQTAIRQRALSGTRLGQMMQTRAKKISNVSWLVFAHRCDYEEFLSFATNVTVKCND